MYVCMYVCMYVLRVRETGCPARDGLASKRQWRTSQGASNWNGNRTRDSWMLISVDYFMFWS